MAERSTLTSRMNPYTNPGPWGVVYVGGLLLPGVVKSIGGCDRPEQWEVQKATEKSNATTVWKGTKIAESMDIVLALFDRASFDAIYDVRDKLRPKIGTKPPSYSIKNPKVNFSGCTRVSCRDVTTPEWVEGEGYWTSTVQLVEYNPSKPANTGAASAAPAGGTGKDTNTPDPNADVKRQLDATIQEANKL